MNHGIHRVALGASFAIFVTLLIAEQATGRRGDIEADNLPSLRVRERPNFAKKIKPKKLFVSCQRLAKQLHPINL
jgi:hypothetical protein